MSRLKVLYEDNHIIVVLKPYNILSQADCTGDIDLLSMVKNYIKDKYNKPGNGLVHRLDRPVGGIMVFARTSKAAARLTKQIEKHQMEKKYLAIINGIIKEKTGRMVDKIERLDNGSSVISEKGKEAILDYKVLDVNLKSSHSLVLISLITGRHHQIRVQFSSRGYPLCGDCRYGTNERGQIALYAYELSFFHPVTKERMVFRNFPEREGYWTDFTL